jgi:hypothetical protein
MSEFWSVIFSEEFLSTVVRVLVPLLFASNERVYRGAGGHSQHRRRGHHAQ